MNSSLTIVLPVHNGESRLRANVQEVLELAGELTDRFTVLIVDDGSLDDTYEVANELATEFPQVRVKRQSRRRGLGPMLESLRGSVRSDVVVVHDGIQPLDANQLRRLWAECAASHRGPNPRRGATAQDAARELAGVARTHATLAAVHRRATGFHLAATLATGDHRDETSMSSAAPQTEASTMHRHARGVGRIPPLPRPNFLEAIADFALGE